MSDDKTREETQEERQEEKDEERSTPFADASDAVLPQNEDGSESLRA